MKVLLFLIAMLSLMARSTAACSIASTQAASPAAPSCFQFQPAISGSCQLAGIEAIKNRDYKEAALANLAFEYALAGESVQALDLSDPKGRSGKLGVLTYLASEYARKGEKPKVIALFNSILNLAKSSATPTEFAEIALTYYQAIGDRAKAVAILDQALNQVKQKPDPNFQDFALSRIAETYVAVGKVEKALQVVNLLSIDREIPERSEREKAQTLANIANTLHENGAFKEALQILRSIKKEKLDPVAVGSRIELLGFADEKSRLLTQMIYQAVNNKQYDRAVQAAQAMDKPSERDRFIQTIKCSRRKR